MKKLTTVLIFMFLAATLVFAAGTIHHDYWPDGKLRVTKAYDDMGDLREVSYYRQDGSLEQHIKYDRNDHKVEESYYDKDGKLRDGIDGWAALRMSYKNGKERQESYYDSDGQLQERKSYNSSGDLVGKQYVGDKTPLPAEEYNPIPPITGYETTSYYDSYGRPEGTVTLDRDPEWWGWPYGPYDD